MPGSFRWPSGASFRRSCRCSCRLAVSSSSVGSAISPGAPSGRGAGHKCVCADGRLEPVRPSARNKASRPCAITSGGPLSDSGCKTGASLVRRRRRSLAESAGGRRTRRGSCSARKRWRGVGPARTGRPRKPAALRAAHACVTEWSNHPFDDWATRLGESPALGVLRESFTDASNSACRRDVARKDPAFARSAPFPFGGTRREKHVSQPVVALVTRVLVDLVSRA